MIQRGDGTRFVNEALGKLRVRYFDRDVAIQARVARPIHLAHAARADGREDFIGAEAVTCGKGHRIMLSFLDQEVDWEWITAHGAFGSEARPGPSPRLC